MGKVALLFPGQGAQSVGMGKELWEASPAARAVFDEVDGALKGEFAALCFEGPAEQLRLTENAQPALLTHSIAVLRAVEARRGRELTPAALAGHSLGEWTALVASRAIDLADAARLVRLRGQLMQRAVAAGDGAMSALLGLTAAQVDEICKDAAADTGGVVVPATFNGAGNIVVSGHGPAVARASALATERGAKAVRPLAVSAPFHSPLMKPVAAQLADALEGVEIRSPRTPVRSTAVDGWLDSADRIRQALVLQLTEPVRWEQCLRALVADGVARAWVMGAGRQMARMVQRMRVGLSAAWVRSAEAPDEEGI